MKRIIIFFIGFFLMISSMAVSQDFPTRGEVYDYDIGDVFHRRLIHCEGESSANGTETVLINKEVNDKFYTINNDSVCYVYFIKKLEFNDWSTEEDYSEYTSTSCLTNLEELVEGDTVYENPALYNGRNTVHYFNMIVEGPNETTNSYRRTIGLGNTYDYSKNWSWATLYKTEYINELVYYKKGGEEWGEEQTIVGFSDIRKEKQLLIYPIPALGFINVQSNENSIIQVYSTTGQLMMEQPVYEVHGVVEVSILLKGVYIIQEIDPLGQVKAKSKFLKL